MKKLLTCVALALSAAPVIAGPPYVTDDPEPTGLGHYETYLFTGGSSARDGWEGSAGIDFNYGAAPDLQLTAVVPVAWNAPDEDSADSGLGNVEFAAKYKFLHQTDVGVDVAFFPRVFLPAESSAVGEDHTSLLLPIWIGYESGAWNTFGGGGCVINRGDDGAKDFCTVGWALTRQVADRLQIGVEIHHESADTKDGKPSTGLGLGATYDLDDNFHVMASVGPGIQNPSETGRVSWYAALLLTF